MPIDDFTSIEFGICIKGETGRAFYRIPIDDSVREALVEMIEGFYIKFKALDGPTQNFEPSEQYPNSARLKLPIDYDGIEWMKEFYDIGNLPVSAVTLKDLASKVIFYFGSFKPKDNPKFIGVKRPSQFKGLLKKKLFAFLDDTLQSVTDSVFKLDDDFDFVIRKTRIEILHPTGFIFISDLDTQILEKAGENARQLGTRISCVKFDAIADFVTGSKTGARMVASIKARTDLENTSIKKVKLLCDNVKIPYKVVRGKIIPNESAIFDFLRVLDRREYPVDLTDDEPEVYVAGNRSKKSNHINQR